MLRFKSGITHLKGCVIPEGGRFIIIKAMPRCGSWLFLFHFTLKQALGSFTKKAMQKMHGFNDFGGERGIRTPVTLP